MNALVMLPAWKIPAVSLRLPRGRSVRMKSSSTSEEIQMTYQVPSVLSRILRSILSVSLVHKETIVHAVVYTIFLSINGASSYRWILNCYKGLGAWVSGESQSYIILYYYCDVTDVCA